MVRRLNRFLEMRLGRVAAVARWCLLNRDPRVGAELLAATDASPAGNRAAPCSPVCRLRQPFLRLDPQTQNKFRRYHCVFGRRSNICQESAADERSLSRGTMMFGFGDGESVATLACNKTYMKAAQRRWRFLTSYDLSTIENEGNSAPWSRCARASRRGKRGARLMPGRRASNSDHSFQPICSV